jgi:hypothetical protein
VPSPSDLRSVRDHRRRALGGAAYFTFHDTEADADFALVCSALNDIIEARESRPRKGRPLNARLMLEIFKELRNASIPIAIWKGSPAHKHIIATFGFVDDASPGTPDGAAFSTLRKLGDLLLRLGLRYRMARNCAH